MNNKEIKELSEKELNIALIEERLNFSKLSLQNAVSPIENPRLINESKKTIARILTEKKARQLATA
ncbi:MAG: 50S ribosomal protein L29 [Bacteroidia bacterium]|nr:50S ribosomal protein L29 [Bacteroidia bacterium]